MIKSLRNGSAYETKLGLSLRRIMTFFNTLRCPDLILNTLKETNEDELSDLKRVKGQSSLHEGYELFTKTNLLLLWCIRKLFCQSR